MESTVAPSGYRPNLRLVLTVLADIVLHACTSGSTAAANVAPSAAFFGDAPIAAPLFLYA